MVLGFLPKAWFRRCSLRWPLAGDANDVNRANDEAALDAVESGREVLTKVTAAPPTPSISKWLKGLLNNETKDLEMFFGDAEAAVEIFLSFHYQQILVIFCYSIWNLVLYAYHAEMLKAVMETERCSLRVYGHMMAPRVLHEYRVHLEAVEENADVAKQTLYYGISGTVFQAVVAALVLIYRARFRGLFLRMFAKKERLQQWEFVSSMFGSDVSRHLLLGISVEGMLRFLERMGFILFSPPEGLSEPWAAPWKAGAAPGEKRGDDEARALRRREIPQFALPRRNFIPWV